MSRKLIWNSFWQWNTDNKVALDETRTPTATETTTNRNNSTVMNCLKWLIGIYLGFRFIYSCRYISTCTYTPPASPIMLSLVSVPLLGNIQRDFSRLILLFCSPYLNSLVAQHRLFARSLLVMVQCCNRRKGRRWSSLSVKDYSWGGWRTRTMMMVINT